MTHPFLAHLADHGWPVSDTPRPMPRRDFAVPAAPAGDADAARYAVRALERECLDVATSPEGTRNHNLNRAAFSIGQLVAAGHLDQDTAIGGLRDAAAESGLPLPEIDATLPRSLADGGQHPRDVQLAPRQEVPAAYTLDPNAEGDAEEDDEGPSESIFDRMVRAEINQLRVRDEARQAYESEKAGDTLAAIPDGDNLVDFLAIPDTDAEYRIDKLLPVGGRAVLSAQYKAGKTTMMANLLRSLAEGGQFLSQFAVSEPTKIALLDTELDERMLRRWLREQGIAMPDNVTVFSLRGRLSTFNIVDDKMRDEWARKLDGHDFVILDCLRPALDGAGLDENREAGVFLNAFDELTEQAGVDESVVVHHMGHGAERSRGDSRILDWPDAVWRIVREKHDDPASARFFSAYGRDVDVADGLLAFDERAKRLTFTGASKRDAQAWQLMPDLIRVLSQSADPMSGNAIEKAMTGQFGHPQKPTRAVVKIAVENRMVWTSKGTDRATLHQLNYSHPDVSSTVSGVAQ